MSGEACSALEDTGQPCPCLAYREGEDLTPPIRCLECLHGRSQHRGSPGKPTIASILQGIVAKGALSKKAVSMEEATKETNEGLKKSASKTLASKVNFFFFSNLLDDLSDFYEHRVKIKANPPANQTVGRHSVLWR
jgi:hypothetical protein